MLWAEHTALAGGIIALTVWAAAGIAGTVGARRELQRFAALQAAEPSAGSFPDQRLWSPERVKGWRETQTRRAPSALAVLRIPSIGLQVPVLEGTDQWTLNRAVGHIEDTSEPGMDGNAGIAGHRDGFFRGLKDIRIGDVLELETPGSIGSYRVDRTWIVDPDDVSVLDPTASPAVTLVTCYPFYFVGSAPQRFIVRAVRMGTSERQSRREE